MPDAKRLTPTPHAEPASARATRLVDVSNQLAKMITSLRENRETMQTRHGEPLLTPLPGTLRPAVPAGPAADEVARLREALQAARQGEAALRERLDEIEEANRAVGDELVALQQQIAHTAGVAVVLRRLHEAATPTDVLDGLQEVVINILGCEDFVLLGLGAGRVEVARHMGRSAAQAAALAEDGALSAAIAAGRIRSGEAAAAVAPDLTLLVPLVVRGQAVGAAALFRLLPQKGQLGPLDEEVAELVQVHGALAWRAAQGATDAR